MSKDTKISRLFHHFGKKKSSRSLYSLLVHSAYYPGAWDRLINKCDVWCSTCFQIPHLIERDFYLKRII